MNPATVDGESVEGTSRRYLLHMYVSMTLKEGKRVSTYSWNEPAHCCCRTAAQKNIETGSIKLFGGLPVVKQLV